MIILGVTFGHDAAACLIIDGNLVADVAEERFSRIKHDSGFPMAAIRYCLKQGGIDSQSIDYIAIAGQYLAPGMERHFMLSTEQRAAILTARPRESRVRDLMIGSSSNELPLYIEPISISDKCRFEFVEHHLAHAASAQHTRGKDSPCLIITLDGIGDNVSVAAWRANGSRIEPLLKWGREASLGWFYGNVTEALGWQHGDGEGTTMGLAAYGDPSKVGERLDSLHPWIANGYSFQPFHYSIPSYMNDHGTFHWHFQEALKINSLVDECGAENVAARAQQIIEEQVISFTKYWMRETGLSCLACAGGLFLNVKLNQRIWHEINPAEHWIYPNPGDAGLAVGAALQVFHQKLPNSPATKLTHLYLGPSFDDDTIRSILDERGLEYKEIDNPPIYAANLIAAGFAIGWFQGRMESGPRSLGNRSILMRADLHENKTILNAKVKFRESFRPFCPSFLEDQRDRYLQGSRLEEFMITSFDINPKMRNALPAVTHTDGTIRPQMVRRDTNPFFYDLISRVGELTGEPIVLNTSFNIKGEPIVCHPREALKCFFDTGLDALVIGRFALLKHRVGLT